MKMSLYLARYRMASGIVLLLLILAPLSVMAQSSPFTVARLVVCEDVQDRSPVNVTDVFPAGTDTVFCFLEAQEIQADTQVQIVWYFEEQEVARVPLAIGQGPRWRTYSSKETMGQKGNWKVYLLDDADNILASVQFALE
ncbi:MAG: DUF2914 domain-containing protein [Desulfobacterales bacterium]|jgi:hypothetical protein